MLKVVLHYWEITPPPSKWQLIRTGHIAVSVSTSDRTLAYLGWWPNSYTLNRPPSRKSTSFKQRIIDRPTRFMTTHFSSIEGKCSLYYDLDHVLENSDGRWPPIAIERDHVDSLLAFNHPGNEWSRSASAERRLQLLAHHSITAPPSVKAEEIENFIDKFRKDISLGIVNYQYFLNNCATVTLAALNSGGAAIHGYGIWYPSRLWGACRNKWNN